MSRVSQSSAAASPTILAEDMGSRRSDQPEKARSDSVGDMPSQQAAISNAQAPSLLSVDELHFDRRNPRLFLDDDLPNKEMIRRLWREFAVDEVALSIASNGYFAHEVLFAALEGGKYVVVEGNRRLAAVKLLIDSELRAEVGATDLPEITPEEQDRLRSLPVIVCPRKDIWQYIGFKHINGPQPWQSYAKAQYVAWLHNELGIPLEAIASQIGDRHATVKRLYRGLMVLRQAEKTGKFNLNDRWRNHFAFSHLYTGLDYQNIQDLLGINRETGHRENPIPHENLEALGDVCLWLYGRKSTNTRPLVQSQNPDLRRLETAIGNDQGLVALRRGLSLDDAVDMSVGDEELFKGHIIEARQRLQDARGKQLTGDSGSNDILRLANDTLDLAERLVLDMETHRRERRVGRRKDRSVQ